MISVIIPTQRSSSILHNTRQDLQKSALIREITIVAHPNLKSQLDQPYNNELIIFSERTGRGRKLLEGVLHAKSDIILFLHDDTTLPANWDSTILNALENDELSGGAFSLRFNIKDLRLRSLILLSDLFYNLTGELWGDRAIFIRSKVLRKNLAILDVPIMEDVNLSKLMRREGKTILLQDQVVTSADSFLNRGIFNHTLRIIICRLMFLIKVDPKKIYQYYYQQTSSDRYDTLGDL